VPVTPRLWRPHNRPTKVARLNKHNVLGCERPLAPRGGTWSQILDEAGANTGPRPDDGAAAAHLMDALVAAKVTYADTSDFSGVTTASMAANDSSFTYVDAVR
jgi:hypothetical protein